jgi:ribosomal protein S18 acetylase RimI-like enzyme
MSRFESITLKNGKIINLRHIKRSDLDNIWDNFNEVVEEGIYLPFFEKVLSDFEKNNWYHELQENGYLCLIAEDPALPEPNNVVGQCTIEDIQWEASDHVGVLGIIVKQGYRNQGIGYHLITYALKESKKIGKEKIILSTFSTNSSAIELYKKLGFEIVGLRKKQFLMHGRYIDETLMDIWIGDD